MVELVQSLFGGRLAEDLKLSSIIAKALFHRTNVFEVK